MCVGYLPFFIALPPSSSGQSLADLTISLAPLFEQRQQPALASSSPGRNLGSRAECTFYRRNPSSLGLVSRGGSHLERTVKRLQLAHPFRG